MDLGHIAIFQNALATAISKPKQPLITTLALCLIVLHKETTFKFSTKNQAFEFTSLTVTIQSLNLKAHPCFKSFDVMMGLGVIYVWKSILEEVSEQ